MAKVLDLSRNKVRTGEVRISYPHLVTPSESEIGKGKYTVSLIIPKSDTETVKVLKEIQNKIIEEEKNNTFKGKNLTKLQTFLRDGDLDRPEDIAYKNSYFINAKSNTQPTLFDVDRSKVDSEDVLYAGSYALAILNLYAYNTNGNFGVGVGLVGLMKTREGEKLAATNDCSLGDFGVEDDDFFS